MSVNVKKMIVGPVQTNCYLVCPKERSEAVIIDPGDDAFRIEMKLKEAGLVPKAILLTHGHFDHIGAVVSLKERFNIEIYAFCEEKQILSTDMNLAGMIGGERLHLEADHYLKDGELLQIAGMEFKVIHTPGHTIGSCCYLMEREKILFSGDTLFYHSHGRTDFPTGSQSAIIRSIVDKLMVLDEDTVVYPGHECDTTIGSEKMIYGSY